MSIREKFWLWGQEPNAHHIEMNNIYNLPGENKMTPVEGAEFFGIKNMCRVTMEDKPEPPFDDEADKLNSMDKVVWSIIGGGASERTGKGGNDLDEVLKIAKTHPNIIAGITDDFMRPERMALYPPSELAKFRERLHNEISRKLDLWTVIYDFELFEDRKEFLKEFDLISYWTWSGKNIPDLDKNYEKLKKMLQPNQRMMAGCYMWNYGEHKPLEMEMMKFQLETYKRWIEEGKIEGVILCSNCIADIGLDTVDYTREWLLKN